MLSLMHLGGSDLYKQLVEWYPDAKFVHTIRETNSWYESLYNMLTLFDSNPETALRSCHANQWYGFVYYMKHTFGIENLVDNKSKICAYYDQHNKEVVEFMKNRNVSFIQMDMANGDGWGKLCPFLGVEIPGRDFPHSNKKQSIAKKEE